MISFRTAMLFVYAFILMAEICGATAQQNNGTPQSNDTKPNIIIILADDMVISIDFALNLFYYRLPKFIQFH